MQVIGYNGDYRISSSLPEEPLEQLTELPLKDEDGNQLFPISVVCGECYTLLIVSTTSSGRVSDRRLRTEGKKSNFYFDRQAHTQFHSTAAKTMRQPSTKKAASSY